MATIILMGIKHCGKSTQAKIISQKLKIPSYDTDTVIQKQTGLSPREIYTQSGEAAFKAAELEACKYVVQCITESGQDGVVATGGGICNNQEAVDVLRSIGKTVFLIADEKTAADRIIKEASVQSDGTITGLPAYIAKKSPRSLQEARDIFHVFYEERMKLYTSIADASITMQDAPKTMNANRIMRLLDLSVPAVSAT